MKLRVTFCGAVMVLGLTACGSDSAPPAAGSTSATSIAEADTDTDMPSAGAASAACGDKTIPRPAAAGKLPAGFPIVPGWAGTETVTQGKTLVVRGVVRGDPDEIVEVRDAAVQKLTPRGYSRTGGDHEPAFEADVDFTGPHSGNINVRALCQGYLVVTYTFEQ
jgi:hypothetical protein